MGWALISFPWSIYLAVLWTLGLETSRFDDKSPSVRESLTKSIAKALNNSRYIMDNNRSWNTIISIDPIVRSFDQIDDDRRNIVL